MAYDPAPLEWVILAVFLFAAAVVIATNLLTASAMHFMLLFRDLNGYRNKDWVYWAVFHPIAMHCALAVSFMLGAGATYVYLDDVLRLNLALGLPASAITLAAAPSDAQFEWTFILWFIQLGLQLVLAFTFFCGHFFRLSAFLAALVFGIAVTNTVLYWLVALEPGLLQFFAAFVYIYVLCYYCYWAFIARKLEPIYRGNYSPVSIIYQKMVTAQYKVKREPEGRPHYPADGGPHRHYGGARGNAPNVPLQSMPGTTAAAAPMRQPAAAAPAPAPQRYVSAQHGAGQPAYQVQAPGAYGQRQ